MDQETQYTEKDSKLADFTDRLLGGKTAPITSASDEELLHLEQTVLRLTHAFPPDSQRDATAKQMLVRFKNRVSREETQAVKPSFWKRIFDFHANPQAGLLLAVVSVLILAVVALPFIQIPGSSVSGSAITSSNFYIAAGLVLVLLAVYWISRNK